MKRVGFGVALLTLAACTSSSPTERAETDPTVLTTVVATPGSELDAELAGGPEGESAGGPEGQLDGDVVVASTSPVSESESVGMQPEGFTTALVEITKADGSTCEVCLWLADTGAERSRGLMGVTDLGAADGMAFVFERPTNGSFFMFQTVTPLSIAWFAPDGELVSMADMAPCESDDSSQCERFPAGGEFQLAIEVFQGNLESIGITAGATAQVLPNTESQTCPATT